MRTSLLFYWNAFWELSSDRAQGVTAPGRIPFHAIDAFARRYGVRGIDDFDRFRSIMRLMDEAYREALTTKTTHDGGTVIEDETGAGIGGLLDRLSAIHADDNEPTLEDDAS